MFSRSCLTVILALSLSGCFTISRASRDSDEEEWGAKWGSDDVESSSAKATEDRPAAGTDKKNQDQVAKAMPPPTQPPPPRVQPDPVPTPTPPVLEPEPASPIVAKAAKRKNKKRKRRPRRKRKKKRRVAPKPPDPEPGTEAEATNTLELEEPPEPGQVAPARAPVVLYPPEGGSEPDTIPLPPTGSALGQNPEAVNPTGPAMPTGEPDQNADPEPEPVPVVTPRPEPPSGRVESKATPRMNEPWVYIDAQGGIYITQKGKVQPAVGVGVGVNLGRLVGWRGLYLGADVDIIIGQVPLGTADYVMLDSHFGFRGRFEVGPVKILAGLGFGLRNAFISGYTSTSEPATHLGFGLVVSAGVEVPVWGPLSVVVEGDGRYIKDPFSSKFFFSSMVGGGVGLVF